MLEFARCGSLVLALSVVLVMPSAARPTRPAPVPSPSTIAPGASQTPQLPSGADTGIPGTGQKPSLGGNIKGDNTPRKLQQRRAAGVAASAPAVDDRAAARAAGRVAAPSAKPASAPR